MWNAETRARHNRDRLRYPSDLTDEEWALVEPLIPPAKRGGRRRSVDAREVVNGLMYVLSTGCQWRYVPKDQRRSVSTRTWRFLPSIFFPASYPWGSIWPPLFQRF